MLSGEAEVLTRPSAIITEQTTRADLERRGKKSTVSTTVFFISQFLVIFVASCSYFHSLFKLNNLYFYVLLKIL